MNPDLETPNYSSKAECRRHFKHLRSTLDLAKTSQALCDRLCDWPRLQQARTVLSYCATANELNLAPLIARWPDKTWGLPRTLGDRLLAWHRYAPTDPLHLSKWGILEPDSNSPSIALELVDIVLVPAIACDRKGMRLGYGAGFYDRCLAQSSLRKALTVGVVPNVCWSIDALPCDPWDIPLAAIATEREIWMRTSVFKRLNT